MQSAPGGSQPAESTGDEAASHTSLGELADIQPLPFFVEPTFLSQEQQDIYASAHQVYADYFGPSIGAAFFRERGDAQPETYEYEGWTYSKATGPYAKWSDFQAMLNQTFVEGYLESLTGQFEQHPTYLNRDGDVYFIEGARGSHIDYLGEPDLYQPVYSSDTEVIFNVIGRYQMYDTDIAYTMAYPIHLSKTADGWRVSEFSLTY